MDRPSALTRFFMGIVAWAEGLNLKYAKLGNPPVYNSATFPWAAEIEKDYPAIRAELEKVLLRQSELPTFQDISTDVKTISTDTRWKTFFLLGFGALMGNAMLHQGGGYVGLVCGTLAIYGCFAAVANATFGRPLVPTGPLR